MLHLAKDDYIMWQHGVAVISLGVSTKLLYVGPG